MAYAFRLIAKKDIRKKGSGTVVFAKGMSIEHVEQHCSGPSIPNLLKTFKQKYGEDVGIDSISNCFEVIKL